MRKLYGCVSNIQILGEESKLKHVDNLYHLKNDKLKNIIHYRLVDHITSCERLILADYQWQFITHNLRQTNTIIKMAGIYASYGMLQAIERNRALFSLE